MALDVYFRVLYCQVPPSLALVAQQSPRRPDFKTNCQIPVANIKDELRTRAITYEISDSSGISIGLEKKDAARVAGRAERQAVADLEDGSGVGDRGCGT
ncbi:hypothetical protein PAAG_07820 [Paracoccidioides lutzii Pb01]|uniref:Uncharacterized protein n=1 Tax=Paracoccidioides lutzii (strain ATCC MYA-826 / Pb01) TaxID=502779 RepID=C1HA91_PARBA|nr:hypothetical protein PAAG_07820 [Paracoccidioides lutzii Pb01]EEH37264.2 hypothetical protein PAAG_07820 [Paracoccidioides lutzii Pb01]